MKNSNCNTIIKLKFLKCLFNFPEENKKEVSLGYQSNKWG